MSIENETVDTDDTNLDDFSAEFFGQSKAPPETTKPEVDESTDDGEDAPPEADQDAQDGDEDDTPAAEEVTEEEVEEKEAPKPKKNSAQERISELTAARREAERRADALEARLAALEKPATKDEPPAPAPTVGAEASPPKPTDTAEDGTEKYPLGEFDPNFITDLADFRVEQLFAQRDQQAKQEAERAKQQEAVGQLEAEWNGQLETARERYPDYNEKIADLQPVFSDIDNHYGEYLSNTLMSMEKGTDILYYLAENPDEARKIVESGPQKATIALGRIEARFISEESTPPRKVSNAPVPPPTNKGASSARGAIAPDTDDLDAFSDMFFKKK